MLVCLDCALGRTSVVDADQLLGAEGVNDGLHDDLIDGEKKSFQLILGLCVDSFADVFA